MAQSSEYPDLRWIPPHAFGTGRDGKSVRYIVIHYTAGAERNTSAEDGAAYDQHRRDGTSTHYFVDSNSVVQCVRTRDRGNAARHKGNRLGIQYELCGTVQTRAQWLDAASLPTLRNAARQVGRDCRKYNIPVRRLSVAETRRAWTDYPNGPKGIVGHVDCTNAYPEDGGDHTDPGAQFPWDIFLDLVRAELAGKPAAEENDMPTVDDLLKAKVRVGDEDWYLGTAIGYTARKSYEAVRDLGVFVSGEVARDAQTAAMLAGMNKALTALAGANGGLTDDQVAALTDQVREAAAAAGAAATAAVEAKIESLRQHLGDTADA